MKIPTFAASIVMPTRNRKDLLQQALLSALDQSVPVEVIVMDDGSTDGTVEMVRAEFPQVKLCQLGSGRGPCFQRNWGIEMASCPIVFPIDDDSIFSSPQVVEETLRDFNHERVAAVGIPFLNPRLNWRRQQVPPRGSQEILVVHAFVGAAHALRKDAFLQVGGYREHFFYMGEEGDLCLRLLQAGHVVRLGTSSPIFHMESPRRNLALADFCGRRNDVLFAWHNVPMPWLLFHLAGTTFNGFRSAISSRHPISMIHGTLSGYADCFRCRDRRSPVPASVYRLHRKLKKSGPCALQEIEVELQPVVEGAGGSVAASLRSARSVTSFLKL